MTDFVRRYYAVRQLLTGCGRHVHISDKDIGSVRVPEVEQSPVAAGNIGPDYGRLILLVQQELWLDMPTPAVPFTLQSFTWVDGAAPDFSSASTRYAMTVRWNGTKFLANLAYTEALA